MSDWWPSNDCTTWDERMSHIKQFLSQLFCFMKEKRRIMNCKFQTLQLFRAIVFVAKFKSLNRISKDNDLRVTSKKYKKKKSKFGESRNIMWVNLTTNQFQLTADTKVFPVSFGAKSILYIWMKLNRIHYLIDNRHLSQLMKNIIVTKSSKSFAYAITSPLWAWKLWSNWPDSTSQSAHVLFSPTKMRKINSIRPWVRYIS